MSDDNTISAERVFQDLEKHVRVNKNLIVPLWSLSTLYWTDTPYRRYQQLMLGLIGGLQEPVDEDCAAGVRAEFARRKKRG